MLHYYGDQLAMELAEGAKNYFNLFPEHFACATDEIGKSRYIPFIDLALNKQRFVKFEWLNDQWVFTDIVD